MGEDVKKYIQEGIHFSNDIMDVIEDVSQSTKNIFPYQWKLVILMKLINI